MRTRMYGGVEGRKTKVGRKLTFVFLLPDFSPWCYMGRERHLFENFCHCSVLESVDGAVGIKRDSFEGGLVVQD